eukprot:gb/GEZN01011729.1/.p1 GENE.gb/GEZN01011729.1/~~gb/GEZN01011729.1/.p1  ORF type:complete len:110 (+),score=4.84 gb/GEZN01011729.1/:680-1009(+)
MPNVWTPALCCMYVLLTWSICLKPKHYISPNDAFSAFQGGRAPFKNYIQHKTEVNTLEIITPNRRNVCGEMHSCFHVRRTRRTSKKPDFKGKMMYFMCSQQEKPRVPKP